MAIPVAKLKSWVSFQAFSARVASARMVQANNPCVPLALLMLTLLAGGVTNVSAAGNGTSTLLPLPAFSGVGILTEKLLTTLSHLGEPGKDGLE